MFTPICCLSLLVTVFLSQSINLVSRVGGVSYYIKPQARIIGGDEAIPHIAPFMVAIIIDNQSNPVTYRLCGGSLISHKYVLTAAHCLLGRKIRHILLGANNRIIEESEQRKVKAARYFIHEEFGGKTGVGYRHDLAVIELETPVTFNKYIQAVALPIMTDRGKTYAGELARAYGWGIIDEETHTIPDRLYHVDLPIIPLNECRKQDKRHTTYTCVFSEDLCTSGEHKKGHCHGDSGGPLVLNGTLIGVISRGFTKHCEHGEPSVYTGISNHLDWIQAHTDLEISTHCPIDCNLISHNIDSNICLA